MVGASWTWLLASMLAASDVPDRLVGPSTNASGLRGLWRLDAARGQGVDTFAVQIAGMGASAAGLRSATDREQFTLAHGNLAWEPLLNLQLGLGLTFATYAYQDAYRLTTYRLGSPTLRVKYGRLVAPNLWLGAALHGTTPTDVGGEARLAPRASAATGALLSTWQPAPRYELNANLGYTLDRSRRLTTREPTPDQRLAYNQYAGDHARAAVGGQVHASPLAGLRLSGFTELAQDLGLGAGTALAPLRLAAGGRLVTGGWMRIEVALGVDTRLGPARHDAAQRQLPPSLPWQAFAVGTVHFGEVFGGAGAAATERPERAEAPAPAPMNSVKDCVWDLDCRFGQQCVSGECAVVIQRPVPIEVKPKPPAAYVVAGVVLDADNRRPVTEAWVELKHHEGTRLRVDPGNGTFRTWRVPLDESLDMTAFASGYMARRVVVRPFEGRPLVRVAFTLKADPKMRPVTVRGLLRDRIWGTAVRGTAQVTALNRQAYSDAQGHFEMHLPAGRHELIIDAPGYTTQRKQLASEPGETIVINADLEPFRRRSTLPP